MRHKSIELMGIIKAFVEEYYKKYLLAMSDNGMIRYDGQQVSIE